MSTLPPMKLKQQEPKSRTCLRCGKKFQSEGPGNRICSSCKGKASKSSNVPRMRKRQKDQLDHPKPDPGE